MSTVPQSVGNGWRQAQGRHEGSGPDPSDPTGQRIRTWADTNADGQPDLLRVTDALGGVVESQLTPAGDAPISGSVLVQ